MRSTLVLNSINMKKKRIYKKTISRIISVEDSIENNVIVSPMRLSDYSILLYKVIYVINQEWKIEKKNEEDTMRRL